MPCEPSAYFTALFELADAQRNVHRPLAHGLERYAFAEMPCRDGHHILGILNALLEKAWLRLDKAEDVPEVFLDDPDRAVAVPEGANLSKAAIAQLDQMRPAGQNWMLGDDAEREDRGVLQVDECAGIGVERSHCYDFLRRTDNKMNNLSPILQAAADVLADLPGKQAHVREIADHAARRNLNLNLSTEDFVSKLTASLNSHVRAQDAKFTKVPNKDASGKIKNYRKGVYRLKRQFVKGADQVHVAPSVSNGYMGKAGEHAVMSELLFWGFNASLMAVDTGIDIVASKDNLYFHLQVKASSPRADGKFGFSVKSSAFEANNRSSTYYVFVMRYPNRNLFAVLPSNYLAMQRKLGVIKDSDSTLSIVIAGDTKGKAYTLNGREVTPFINAFGLIK